VGPTGVAATILTEGPEGAWAESVGQLRWRLARSTRITYLVLNPFRERQASHHGTVGSPGINLTEAKPYPSRKFGESIVDQICDKFLKD
jgi:hypothetical protein